MKTVFLLRHAQALSDSGDGDFNRPLSPHGLAQARMLGRVMQDRNYQPAQVWCSAARRTRETLDGLIAGGLAKPGSIVHERSIYDEGTENILALLRAADDSSGSVLVVGHNPSVHMLAARLAGEDERLATQYPPATLSVFSCTAESWRDFRAQDCTLKDVIYAES